MIWAIIPAPIKRAAAWVLAGLVAVLGVWGAAKRDARQKAALGEAKAYRETRKEIDNAATDLPSGDDALRQRMRERGKRRGDM